MPESVISQENNSPLALYIEFQKSYFFLDINSPGDQVQANTCTIAPNITHLSIKVEGRCILKKVKNLVKFVYSSIRQLYCCDITDISTVAPERAAYKKLSKPEL